MSTGIHTKILLRGPNFPHTGRQPKNKRTSWCELALEQDGGGLISEHKGFSEFYFEVLT